MLHFNGENYGRAGAGNWASVVPMVLPHIAVGRFLLHTCVGLGEDIGGGYAAGG